MATPTSPAVETSYKNVLQIIADVQSLHAATRFVSAGKKLLAVEKFLAHGRDGDRKEVKAAVALLSGELRPSFDQLRERAAECERALQDWESVDWHVAQTFMGVTTAYKHDPDGSLCLKMSGNMDDVRLLDQLATVREVDLFKTWAPFCDKSCLLKRIGMVELLVHLNTALPGTSRDCVLHAYGCDAVLEANCILIHGKSVDRWDGVEIPEVKGWRHARMDVRTFNVKIEVLSPTSARTSIVANIDPKAPLPRPVVNFFVRKVAGMFLYCLKQAAARISEEEDNAIRQRILKDEDFYTHWLHPRIQQFYSERGWALGDALPPETGSGCGASPLTDRLRTNVVAGVGCTPFLSSKCRQISRSLGGIKKRRRSQKAVATPVQAQIQAGEVELRLLEKWQARRQARDSCKKPSYSVRLVASVLSAMCAAFFHSLCVSDTGMTCRMRIFVASALFAASFFVATGLL